VSLVQALVLGLVQGLTEFIPVSSSAHLALVPWYLGWSSPTLAYSTVLHLGTLAAVVGVFWRDLATLAVAWVQSIRQRSLAAAGSAQAGSGGQEVGGGTATGQSALAWALIIGTVPAITLGLLVEGYVEALFSSPGWVSALLIGTGLLLWASERWVDGQRPLLGITLHQALFVGLAQCLAMAPGISRSGATISAGRITGLSRADAARFSFLLSIPVISGAGVLQVYRLATTGPLVHGATPLVVGFLASLISGYLVIRLLLSYLQRHTLLPFAIYCGLVGALGLIVWFVH